MSYPNVSQSILKRAIVAAAVVLAVSLSGCAQQEPTFDPAVAEQLQSQVLAVSKSAAATDYEAAIVTLDELDVQIKDALAKEQISQARHDSIAAAAALVRADLQAAILAEIPPPQPSPTPTSDEGSDGDGDKGKGNDKDEED